MHKQHHHNSPAKDWQVSSGLKQRWAILKGDMQRAYGRRIVLFCEVFESHLMEMDGHTYMYVHKDS